MPLARCRGRTPAQVWAAAQRSTTKQQKGEGKTRVSERMHASAMETAGTTNSMEPRQRNGSRCDAPCEVQGPRPCAGLGGSPTQHNQAAKRRRKNASFRADACIRNGNGRYNQLHGTASAKRVKVRCPLRGAGAAPLRRFGRQPNVPPPKPSELPGRRRSPPASETAEQPAPMEPCQRNGSRGDTPCGLKPLQPPTLSGFSARPSRGGFFIFVQFAIDSARTLCYI